MLINKSDNALCMELLTRFIELVHAVVVRCLYIGCGCSRANRSRCAWRPPTSSSSWTVRSVEIRLNYGDWRRLSCPSNRHRNPAGNWWPHRARRRPLAYEIHVYICIPGERAVRLRRTRWVEHRGNVVSEFKGTEQYAATISLRVRGVPRATQHNA